MTGFFNDVLGLLDSIGALEPMRMGLYAIVCVSVAIFLLKMLK